MKNIRYFKTLTSLTGIGLALLSVLVSAAAKPSETINLDTLDDSFETFVRVRGEATGTQDVITWFSGTLYLALPGKRPQAIMGFEGFNNTRTVPTAPGKADLMVREVMYYTDLDSGEIIEQWENPFTEAINEVIHVSNDPVNHKLTAERARYNWIDQGDEDMQLRLDVPLAYPNPLQPDEYPAESSGPMYTGSEHFLFFFKRADMENKELNSIPATFAWFRTGPVLPWMKMGQTPGYLIYSATGKKWVDGYDKLPAHIREYTEKHYPKYIKAPTEFTQPNETSWTYFKKVIDEQRKK